SMKKRTLGCAFFLHTNLRHSTETRRFLARLRAPVDDDDPADEWNQADQLPPAAAVDVMQAPCGDGDIGQYHRQREQLRQPFVDAAEYDADDDDEQDPPPEFRPCCAAVEIGVFPETGTNRFGECHGCPPLCPDLFRDSA